MLFQDIISVTKLHWNIKQYWQFGKPSKRLASVLCIDNKQPVRIILPCSMELLFTWKFVGNIFTQKVLNMKSNCLHNRLYWHVNNSIFNFTTAEMYHWNANCSFLIVKAVGATLSSSSPCSYHVVRPPVDSFRSHTSRSIFNDLSWFLVCTICSSFLLSSVICYEALCLHVVSNFSCSLVCFWSDSPQWAMVSSCTKLIDHTQWHTAVGRTPLDEWSARRRDIYLRAYNILNRQTSMPPGGIRTHNLCRRAAADLRFKGAIHSQLNWAILLCDVMPEGKTE